MRRTIALLVATIALLASACRGAPDAPAALRDELDALEATQVDLRQRIAAVEGDIEALPGTGPLQEAVSAAATRLDAVDQALADLSGGLAAERSDREDRDAVLTAAVASLREAVDDLEASLGSLQQALQELRAEHAKLREDHDLLRDRFDRHLAQHGGG